MTSEIEKLEKKWNEALAKRDAAIAEAKVAKRALDAAIEANRPAPGEGDAAAEVRTITQEQGE